MAVTIVLEDAHNKWQSSSTNNTQNTENFNRNFNSSKSIDNAYPQTYNNIKKTWMCLNVLKLSLHQKKKKYIYICVNTSNFLKHYTCHFSKFTAQKLE